MKLLVLTLAFGFNAYSSDGLPGVGPDTVITGGVTVAQKFCSESHANPRAACEDWLTKVTSGLESHTILRSICKSLNDPSLGTCIRTGSLAGIIQFK